MADQSALIVMTRLSEIPEGYNPHITLQRLNSEASIGGFLRDLVNMSYVFANVGTRVSLDSEVRYGRTRYKVIDIDNTTKPITSESTPAPDEAQDTPVPIDTPSMNSKFTLSVPALEFLMEHRSNSCVLSANRSHVLSMMYLETCSACQRFKHCACTTCTDRSVDFDHHCEQDPQWWLLYEVLNLL